MNFVQGKTRRRLSTAGLLLLVGCMGCGPDDAQEPALRPVRYVEVTSGAGQQTRTFSGIARARLESRLSFKVAGTIQNLPVVVGSRVSTGDLIASLDPTNYLLTEQESLAALRQAEAQAQNAEDSYQRVKGLYENNNASKSDLEGARAAAESARQGVNVSKARLEQARLQVSYARLTAPEAGAIAEIDVEVNENVQPGQRVVVLTSGGRPEVQVAVPEGFIGDINIGDAATVRIDALPNTRYQAVVHEVGVATVGTATTFPVTVQLMQEESEIRPGMAAEVAFILNAPTDAPPTLVVPSSAVGDDRNGKFVFVLDPTDDGAATAKRTDVTLGSISSRGIEIVAGIHEGDYVATAGVSYLREGQRVKLLPSSAE